MLFGSLNSSDVQSGPDKVQTNKNAIDMIATIKTRVAISSLEMSVAILVTVRFNDSRASSLRVMM